MRFDRLNNWLTLFANLGVIAGLVFVGFEIRQNTLAMDRQIRIEFADNVHGQLAESDHLAPIVTKIMAAQENSTGLISDLSEEFDLTQEEAQRWWRHLFQVWLRDEADWLYDENAGCSSAAFRLQYRDQQLFFENMKQLLNPEFVVCVEYERSEGNA